MEPETVLAMLDVGIGLGEVDFICARREGREPPPFVPTRLRGPEANRIYALGYDLSIAIGETVFPRP